MFIVRTIDTEHNTKDVVFDDITNAIDCYLKKEDKNIRSIAVLNKDECTVICIKLFKGGETCELKDGDIVRLRSEYCTKEESQYIYTISDINESTERCSITCMNGTMTIPSKETVNIDMIKVV